MKIKENQLEERQLFIEEVWDYYGDGGKYAEEFSNNCHGVCLTKEEIEAVIELREYASNQRCLVIGYIYWQRTIKDYNGIENALGNKKRISLTIKT